MKRCRTNTLQTTPFIGLLLIFLGCYAPLSISAQGQQSLTSEMLSKWSHLTISTKSMNKVVRKKSKLKTYTQQLTHQNNDLRARFQALGYQNDQWKGKTNPSDLDKQNYIELNLKYARLIDELQHNLGSAYKVYECALEKGTKHEVELAYLKKELKVLLHLLEASKEEFKYFKENATPLELRLLLSRIELVEARQQISIQGTTIFINETQPYNKLRNKTISRKEEIVVETVYYMPANKFGRDFNTTVPAVFHLIKPDGSELKQRFNLKIISEKEETKQLNFTDKPVFFTPIQRGVMLQGKKTVNLGKLLSKEDFSGKKQRFPFRIEINQEVLLHGELRLKQ